MTKLSFVAFDGTRFDVDAENGSTVMENAIRNAVPGIEAEVQTPAVTREEQAQLLPKHPAEDLAVHNAPAAERRQKVARHVRAGYSPSQPQSPRSGATELFDFAEPSVARETSQCESAIEPADDEFVATTSDFGDQTSHDPDYRPAFPSRKGGGVLTIPLICIGIATIACTTLLPLADDNHRQSWEREKLKQDLAHLREQVRVNDEFLHRVADDPTLAERLAQRQMKYIRQGSSVLPLRGAGNHEMSPFHLVAVPPPKPLPSYQPAGGALAVLARNPRTQLYASGAALLLIAAGLVLGYVPRPGD